MSSVYSKSPGYCFVLSYDRNVPAALMPADLCLSQGDGTCLGSSRGKSRSDWLSLNLSLVPYYDADWRPLVCFGPTNRR